MRRLVPQHARHLGQLRTPANRNSLDTLLDVPWAIDNGAFSGFDPMAFLGFLERAAEYKPPLWVACPDVVADAAATMEQFDEWQPKIRAMGFRVAYVLQDGQQTVPVPWSDCEAVFIGGSTAWKLSEESEAFAREAKARGKMVHMGRVNSRRRIEHAQAIGCDTIDGTGASMFPDIVIPKYLRWMKNANQQRKLL